MIVLFLAVQLAWLSTLYYCPSKKKDEKHALLLLLYTKEWKAVKHDWLNGHGDAFVLLRNSY